MQRTKHTPGFKDEAVKQVIDKGHSVNDVAKLFGIAEGVLYTWVIKFKKADEPESNDLKAMQAEMVKPKAELRRTKEERDILKMPAAYFAKQSGLSTRLFKRTEQNSDSPACAVCSRFITVAFTHGCMTRSQRGQWPTYC